MVWTSWSRVYGYNSIRAAVVSKWEVRVKDETRGVEAFLSVLWVSCLSFG